jgi:hypothetical protein
LISQFLVVAGVLAALPSDSTVKKLEALPSTRLSGSAERETTVEPMKRTTAAAGVPI